ncbi:MAG: hypothetical protein DDT19_01684 [Syntrophomonadaceae bacterium]|nr:hypothetical protein [Bacillota bacterium]
MSYISVRGEQSTTAEIARLAELNNLGNPNADRILFWNNSTGALAYLTAGAGLTITGTTMTAAGGGTVTSVTSANADATVATTTTTPVITIVSAPRLTTARTIAGVPFDGTANIAIPASGLSNGVTGSGAVVLATSPTLVTPALGIASATSLTTSAGATFATASGNVGIGTTAPATRLHVAGTTRGLGGAQILVLPTPGTPTVTPQGTTGTTTWSYRITARSSVGETLASTAGTTTTGNAILGATDFNRITWSAVAGAVDYRIYRTTAGGTPSTTGLIGTTASLIFDDTGLAASGAVPTIDSSGNVGIGTTTPTERLSVVGALGAGSIELGHATDTTLARVSAGVVSIEGSNILVSGGALGTPSSGTLTNCTGLPTAGLVDDAVTYAKIQNVSATDRVLGRTTIGAGDIEEIATTGSGSVVRATSPTLVTPALGTPASGVMTNVTGVPNGATTATSANTINAIVARDASGNFSAGTITAALTGTASGNLVSGGALGTPSSGTLTNATGLPVAGIVASTTQALGVGTVELGNVSDTTLSRSAAGVLAVEGVVIPSISSTNTITNKRIEPRIVSAASYTTDTGTSLDVSTTDIFVITAQAGALLFNAPGGAPVQGQRLVIRIRDNGTARALTWNAVFRAMGTALPSTTVVNKTKYLGFFYNLTEVRWDLVAAADEA